VQCYLPEPNVALIRGFATTVEQLVSSEFANAEFAAAIHRQRREQHITKRDADTLIAREHPQLRALHW